MEIIAVAVRVAGQAGVAFVHVTGDFVMLIIHVLLIMLMAVNTTEDSVVVRIDVAVRTEVPLALMTSRVDREERVVIEV